MTVKQRCIQFLFTTPFLVYVFACDRQAGEPKVPSSAVTKAEAGAQSKTSIKSTDTTVTLEPGMMANIKVEQLSEKVLPSTFTATGKVNFNEDQMARILAPVAGQVINLRAKVGDSVAKGQDLFYINSREAAAAISEYLENRKDLELAEKHFALTKDLYDHQAASLVSLQQAEGDLAKAKARDARSVKVLQVLGLNPNETGMEARIAVKTPLNGKVVERSVTEGQFVQPDSNPLMMIADLASLWVLADIYENDLHRIRVGQKAEVTTAAYPDERFMATISRISDVVDPTTRTVKVRFLVSNPAARLKPEMFASVKIFLGEAGTALTLPASAVFTENGKNYVYVQTGTTEFTRRTVEVSPDPSGRLRVVSGLKAGENVVSEHAILVHQEGGAQSKK
jgi:cobalt-zinc-cadmium efflux system membrane fusion protein